MTPTAQVLAATLSIGLTCGALTPTILTTLKLQKESTLMTNPRSYVCVLLAGTLLIITGCRKIPSATGAKGGAVHDVEIKNCKPTTDRVDVYESDSVRWQPSDDDYTIAFSDSTEPTGNPFKVNRGASNSKHFIKGHKGCADAVTGGYDCKYSLTREKEKGPCADPIIHIIPGSG